MTFNPNVTPTNKATLAGVQTPGYCEITAASSPRRWDVRKGPGTSGARSIFRGLDIAKITMRLRLTTPQDFADWATFRPIVMAVPRGNRGYLDIVHPVLAELDISTVGVEDVGLLTRGEQGEWYVEIKFIEHRRPRPGLASPDGSDTEPTPLDPLEVEIQALRTQNQALAARYP